VIAVRRPAGGRRRSHLLAYAVARVQAGEQLFAMSAAIRRASSGPFTVGSSERQHAWGAIVLQQSCPKPTGGNNGQNYSYCFVRVVARLCRSSNAGCAGSSVREHDHASSYGLRRGQGHGQRCLPVQSRHAPGAPSHAQVCAIQRRRLSGSSSVALRYSSLTEIVTLAKWSGPVM
jgi:hypothetical protein